MCQKINGSVAFLGSKVRPLVYLSFETPGDAFIAGSVKPSLDLWNWPLARTRFILTISLARTVLPAALLSPYRSALQAVDGYDA